nr:hypothetical protein [uncultured Cupriavidus sp.]
MTDLTALRSPFHMYDTDDITISGDEAHAVLVGIDGVLELLDRHSETSEQTFNAFCLPCLVRGHLEDVLRDAEP